MCNDSSCGCNSNPCLNLGPFTAVNPQCPTPEFGYMIPYASNDSQSFYNDSDGSTPFQIGFGNNNPVLIDVDGTITLDGTSFNIAFTVSEVGSVSAISATFTNSPIITVTNPATVKVRAQLYKAPPGSNTFIPTDATVVIISVTGTDSVADNTTSVNSSSFFPPIPIAIGERLLMVYSATKIGTGAVSNIQGTVSASVSIM